MAAISEIEANSCSILHTVYLVRHAESVGNVERLFLPPDEDVLSPNGQIQAELLGKHLSEIKFTKMFSSDYARAVETAAIILSESKYSEDEDLIINTDFRLRERDYGSLEGLPYKEGFKQLQASNVPIMEFEVPDGESVADTVARMRSFMQQLCDEIDDMEESETILVVSHSFAIVSFFHWLSKAEDFVMMNWDFEKDFKMLGNACYMKIEVEGKLGLQMSPRNLNFVAVNESSHLEELNESEGALSSFTYTEEDAKGFSGCVHQ